MLLYFVLLLSVFVSLPHGAVGWSVVCDCGISWSYSLTFGPLSSLAAEEGCHVGVFFFLLKCVWGVLVGSDRHVLHFFTCFFCCFFLLYLLDKISL